MHEFSKGQFFPLNKEASPGLRTVALGVKDRSPGTQNRAGTPMHHWGVAIANGDPSAGARRQGEELLPKGHSPTGTTMRNYLFTKTFKSMFLEKHFFTKPNYFDPTKTYKS